MQRKLDMRRQRKLQAITFALLSLAVLLAVHAILVFRPDIASRYMSEDHIAAVWRGSPLLRALHARFIAPAVEAAAAGGKAAAFEEL